MSESAVMCVFCGSVLPRSAAVAHSGRLAAVSGEHAAALQGPRQPETSPCPACGSPLEREARFCSECGSATHTGEYASPPIPEPDAEPGDVHDIPYIGDTLVPHDEDAAYEREVGFEPDVVVPAALEPDPGVEPYLDEPDIALDHTGPVSVVREPAAAPPAESPWAWVPPAAGAFAVFALLTAMHVHLFAPSSLPDYSAAELSLKIQMRAVEWLLAGTLMALVGMLAKR